ncbi:MAG TPA: neutral/alkaline non-lysosomal ceramidase N-terminal domain-containing protein [Planctomycetota bacterium]|nr:neutral/alkaline non-lysosomal ceramidase N-terminal domain-containing protein [Planctomycetota bacterium]
MRAAIALVIVLNVLGCAQVHRVIVAQQPVGNLQVSDSPTAGAICVDITPPPGMPMGGYSFLGNRGQGFRTRLKARVVYLNDGKGHSVALAQTDLPAASLLLHHKVAEAVAGPAGLRPGDIAITASHTHSAPANFFENDFYNKHMSSGKWLDVDFLEFLTQRVAQGIVEAHRSRRPARVATGSREIHGYNRNRSLAAYARNGGVNIRLGEPDAAFRAVNPALCMVRVDVQDDRGAYKPLAAFSTFSVHACALTPPVEVYSADLFAYAQKDLERAIQRKYNTPWAVVHALTTGTQGDMAPALPEQGDNMFRHFPVDWRGARKLGQGIGREAIDLFESLGDSLTTDVVLESAVRELNIREHNAVESIKLCRNAAVGNPLVAGAYERRTPLLAAVPFLKGGHWMSRRWWFFKNGPQGNKRHFGFSFLQPLVEPKSSFPNTVMFQLIRVNEAIILPVPFEVTAESGRRMAARVKQEFLQAGDHTIRHVWVASNANGYFGYTTTPEEYSRQEYEGGHTLYGRYSTPYLTAHLGLLARDLEAKGEVHELSPKWEYVLKVNKFYPEARTSTGVRRALAVPTLKRARRENEEDYVRFRWQDVGPSEINFHQPLARVEVKAGDRWEPMRVDERPIDDDGYDLEVRYLDKLADGMGEYEVRWYNPVPGGGYRFVIAARGERAAIVSRAFVYKGSADGLHGEAALALFAAQTITD